MELSESAKFLIELKKQAEAKIKVVSNCFACFTVPNDVVEKPVMNREQRRKIVKKMKGKVEKKV